MRERFNRIQRFTDMSQLTAVEFEQFLVLWIVFPFAFEYR